MIKINLLPKEQRVRHAPVKSTFILGILCTVIIFLAMGYGWYWLNGEVRRLEDTITQTQADLRRYEEIAKQVDRFRAEKKRLEEKIKVIESLVAAQAGPVQLLDEISKSLPNEVWLTAFSRTGKKVELTGIAFTNFNIATFMTTLGKASDLISSVDLVVSEKIAVEQVPVERFTITMEIKEGKG